MASADRVIKGGLQFGPLGDGWAHLCVDMQRMFAGGTPWLVEPGVDEIHLHQVGRNQEAFIETFGEKVLPQLRA